MLAPPVSARPVDRGGVSAPPNVLPAELDFYQAYPWCLNPYLTVHEAVEHLRAEIDRLAAVPNGWQVGEVATNVFLLSCGVLNCVDEYLRGPTLRMPKRLAAMRASRAVKWTFEKISQAKSLRHRAQALRWRDRYLFGFNEFLTVLVGGETPDRSAYVQLGNGLSAQLQIPLPLDLQAKRFGIPTPFRRLDLTHVDVLALGRCFVKRYPDRSQSILLLGLRTSGSYFAPLLKALLQREGFRNVSLLTFEANKGAGSRESSALKSFAAQGFSVLIVDDPPHTAGTIQAAFSGVRKAGFAADKVKILVPAHAATRDSLNVFPDEMLVLLEPEQWHKPALLNSKAIEARLAEYFRSDNVSSVKVIASKRAEEFNDCLQRASLDARGARLKRIFEVQLETTAGKKETRYVLAKSVGWGWLGYHAFLAGQRLSGFVPPILGLRDGILYMEWIPQSSAFSEDGPDRDTRIDIIAAYVAARVRALNLQGGSASGMDLQRQNNGVRLLEKALSGAYGRFPTNTLIRSRLGHSLRQQPCPMPTLIDGNMQRAEWIVDRRALLKTDYEHHGMNKNAINVADPAYDLADAMLDLALSPEEENRLVRRYVDASGDTGIDRRLFMNKLLAGIWRMHEAQEQLFAMPRDAGAQQELHRRFMRAWDFLTIQTARYCGSHYAPPADQRWHAPLLYLDVDGVIDRRLFGFPATTAAGIAALSKLSSHGISVALNTARSVAEVKDYCQAYHLAGGVAEHGSYVWDALAQRGRVLIDPKSERQLEELRSRLQEIPGVFLDDRHRFSIRAFTYQDKPQGLVALLMKSTRSCEIGDGALAPLPELVINNLMSELKLDRLSFHHTWIDTTIVAKEVDKGSGLVALRDWVLGPDAETIAVGDQKADLSMFRAATRSFAPANISCAREARLLGCQIVGKAYQQGLLQIAHAIAHRDGQPCDRCAESEVKSPVLRNLFLKILQAADRSWRKNLFEALFDRRAFRIFMR